MRIQLVSDLHMEFAPIELTNAGADVLLLSGDIVVADTFTRGENSPKYETALRWKSWFERVCAQFEYVIYVMGNHEHYHGRFYETKMVLLEALGHIRNLVILDNEPFVYNSTMFFGTTLWTDFDHDNFKAMMVRDALNDYRIVQGKDYRKLTTGETALYHQKALDSLEYWHSMCISQMVVVGHHAPSYRSITREFAGSVYNPGYASHLDSFIESHSKIKLWTHGHVHSSHDYVIGDTRVVANPRGYRDENRDFNPNLILEI